MAAENESPFMIRVCKNEEKSASQVYSDNESMNFEGRFPVGQNRCWHSGIHVRQAKVYPMLEGWLAACRIPLAYTEVEYPQSILKYEYDTLDGCVQGLYEEDLDGGNASGRNRRYRLKEGSPTEKYSNGFFLNKAFAAHTRNGQPS